MRDVISSIYFLAIQQKRVVWAFDLWIAPRTIFPY